MKKIKFLSIFAMFIISLCILTGCSGKVTAKGSLEVLSATRYTLSIKATVSDNDNQITSGSVSVVLYDTDGTRQTSSSCDSLATSDEGNTQTVTLTALDSNTSYVAKLICTIKDKTVTLCEIDACTTKAGESEEDAIHITCKDDFDKMLNDLDGYYVLDNDISIGTDPVENEETGELETLDKAGLVEWSSLFSSSTSKAFTGTFDGKGYTISNFKQTSSLSYYGFFGYLSEGATIKNVNFKNVYIKSARYSDTYCGTVAGYADVGVTLENVNVENASITISTSTTSGKTFYVGGLVGQYYSGSIIDCKLTDLDMNITGSKATYVGGIAGYNALAQGKWIQDCQVSGNINVSQIYNTSSTFSKSDQIIEIVGGVVGHNDGRIKNTISNINITSSFSIDSSLYDTIYAKVNSEDTSNDAEKEWKIDNSLNVAIGSFVGYNTGIIKDCVTSGDLSFESINAYNVKLGLFCGYNTSDFDLSINNTAYINNDNTINFVLRDEDKQTISTEDTTTSTDSNDEVSTASEDTTTTPSSSETTVITTENTGESSSTTGETTIITTDNTGESSGTTGETNDSDNNSSSGDTTTPTISYERILEFSYLGSNGDKLIYYYELPEGENYSISICEELLGESTAIENFTNAETLEKLITELRKLF